MVQTLEKILSTLVQKEANGIDCSELIRRHLQDIFVVALKCLATFQSFRLNGKPDPENILEAKKGVTAVFKLCQALSAQKDEDFLVRALPPVVEQAFSTCQEEQVSQWSAQQAQFKLLFALVWLCDTEHLILEVTEGISIFDELCRVLRGTLVNHPEAKNVKLKELCIFTVFPVLVNKIKPVLSHTESDALMAILEQAFQIEWGDRDSIFKHLNMLTTTHRELIKCDAIKLKSIETSQEF